MSGSLELTSVQAIAADIERMLANGYVEEAEAAIKQLEQVIAPAIAAARSLKPAQTQTVAPTTAPVNDAAVTAARTELHELVRRRSLRARASFEHYAQALGLTDEGRGRHPVHQALEKLDYEAALKLLDAEENAKAERQENIS